jgi:hypothetical protein
VFMVFKNFAGLPFSRLCIFALCITAWSNANAPVRANFGDELFKLTPSDAASGDAFGRGLDISGNIAIVGAREKYVACPNDQLCNSGAAYVFNVRTGDELFKLTASDAAPGVDFGASVGISGNTAIVGGETDAAYLFDVTTGKELRKLTASDAALGDAFGLAVAISGSIAIVGDPSKDGTGAAYVFDVTSGHELFKLTASDRTAGDAFGNIVDISGNVALVGAKQSARDPQGSGAAYVFDLTTGRELFKLTGSDSQPGDWFGGWSNDINGNIAIIGSAGGKTHAAYVFDVSTGQELRKLTASDNSIDLAWSVAISGNTAILGSRYTLAGNDWFRGWGSAFLFDVTTGEQLKKLIPSDTHQGQWFGDNVAIDADKAIVGALFGDKGTIKDTGSAYVFDVSRGPALSGDFNADDTIDAADYVVWRNRLGTTYTQADYDTWRANFGRSAAGAAPAVAGIAGMFNPAIPEPPTLAFLPLVVASTYLRRGGVRIPSSRRHTSRTFPAQRSAEVACCLVARSGG